MQFSAHLRCTAVNPLVGKVGWRRLALLFFVIMWLAASALAFDMQKLQANEPVMRDWAAMLGELKQATPEQKLRRVNEFFNRRIEFGDDQDIWDRSDYWSAP